MLDKGVLQQVGPPQEVYDRPANIFVAQFLGAPPMNMFPPGLLEPGNHLVGVRPEHLTVDGVGPVAARVTLVESLGHEALLTCVTAGELTLVARPRQTRHSRRRARRCSSTRRSTAAIASTSSPGGGSHREPRPSELAALEALLALAFLAPSFVLFGVFIFYLLGAGVPRPVSRRGRLATALRGWSQYRDVWESNEFHDAMITTVQFALGADRTLLGLGLAILADKHVRGIGAFRSIFSSTVATSVAVASLMWLYLFQPSVGILANMLPFEVLKDPGLLNDPETALLAVSITSIWANLGFTFIVMAGLQSIPDDLYESSELDGASSWMRFTNVTVPMLGPTLLFVIVVLTIRAFQAYGEFDLLTRGPGDETTTMTYLIYGDNSVIRNDLGLQSAAAVLLSSSCSPSRSCSSGSSNGGCTMRS